MYVGKGAYNYFGTELMGNIWVNWFAISFFLLSINTILFGLLLNKKISYFRQRTNSVYFWLNFICSSYIVIIPFVKGSNPF